jgi:cation diffusion facilitator CzcD-associated flavoprotein CzcO
MLLIGPNVDWQAVAKKHNLAKHTQYGSNFLKATWMEADSEYICEFVDAAGEPFTVHCDVLISCIGGFSTPLAKPVGMKGIDSFKGPVFHSARWDYSIDLKGKKVGVIGNGCSAAQ